MIKKLCCAESLSRVRLCATPWTVQLPARLLCPWGFSRQEYRSGLPWPPPRDLPNPGIKPRSPVLQADSLPYEPLKKPKNTGVGTLSLLQGIFSTQESNQGLLHYRQIIYQLSYFLANYLLAVHSTRYWKWESCYFLLLYPYVKTKYSFS